MSKNPLSEAEIDYLEAQIPHMIEGATQNAFYQALAAGLTVTIAENGAIYEVSPDGSRRFIKELPPSVPVVAGSKISIRKSCDGD